MRSRNQWLIVLAVVACLGGVLTAAVVSGSAQFRAVVPGSRAPAFKAVRVGGRPDTVELRDYAGDVVLLNIWATWCPPCVEEMPSIEALHRDMASQGLKVVAVSIDAGNARGAIQAFAADHELTFDILHDPAGDIQQLYQTTGVPETFIIGRDGIIARKVALAADWNSAANRALIAGLLRPQ